MECNIFAKMTNTLHSGCNVRLLKGPQQTAKHELKVKMFTDPFSYRKKKSRRHCV